MKKIVFCSIVCLTSMVLLLSGYSITRGSGTSKISITAQQLTDFANESFRDPRYATISANGEKIIYETAYDQEEGVYSPFPIWVTDTTGSKQQTKIFSGYSTIGGYYYSRGSSGGSNNPVLNSNATIAYFAAVRSEELYSANSDSPVFLCMVDLTTEEFTVVGYNANDGYEQKRLISFLVKENKIYCLAYLQDWENVLITKGMGFFRMNTDGSNQEYLWGAEKGNYPYVGSHDFFVDEENKRLYLQGVKTPSTSIYDSDKYSVYYIDLDTVQLKEVLIPSEIPPESFTLRGVAKGKLVLWHDALIKVYDPATGKITVGENGVLLNSVLPNGDIFYEFGSGRFKRASTEDNETQHIIGWEIEGEDLNSEYLEYGFSWPWACSPYIGSVLTPDGTKMLVMENQTENEDFYLLTLTEETVSTTSSPTTTTSGIVSTTSTAPASSDTVTLYNHWTTGEGFDFLAGEVVTADTYDLEFVGTPDSPQLRAAGESGGIQDMGVGSLASLTSPPTLGYDFSADAAVGHSYWVETADGSYFKIYVSRIDTSQDANGNAASISFEYEAYVATTTTIASSDTSTTTTSTGDDECFMCSTTAECTLALGSGWACVSSCCEQVSVSDNCTASYLLGNQDQRLDTLRWFRDRRLARTAIGQNIIRGYYRYSAKLIDTLRKHPALHALAFRLLDNLLPVDKTISK